MPKVLPRHANDATGQLNWDEYWNQLTVEQQVEFWKTTSGSVTAAFNDGIVSDFWWGDGVILFQNTGTVELDIRIPVDRDLGAAGFLRLATNSGSCGTFTAGINCYRGDGSFLGTRNFLTSSTTISTSNSVFDNFIFGTGGSSDQFPSATSFIKPVMSWSSLSNFLILKSILIRPLGFGYKSLYA